jgi:hypothetical protein
MSTGSRSRAVEHGARRVSDRAGVRPHRDIRFRRDRYSTPGFFRGSSAALT